MLESGGGPAGRQAEIDTDADLFSDLDDTGGPAITWHKETSIKRDRLGLNDLDIKPWTSRATTHLRGLPKQAHAWNFQNEYPKSKHCCLLPELNLRNHEPSPWL